MFYFFCMLLYIHSSFAIILTGKRERVALLCLSVSRDCCVALPQLPWVCLQFVIVVFLDHTPLLFLVQDVVCSVLRSFNHFAKGKKDGRFAHSFHVCKCVMCIGICLPLPLRVNG